MLEVKHFPKDMSVYEVNKANVKECLLTGLFEETVKRTDFLHIPCTGPRLQSALPCDRSADRCSGSGVA